MEENARLERLLRAISISVLRNQICHMWIYHTTVWRDVYLHQLSYDVSRVHLRSDEEGRVQSQGNLPMLPTSATPFSRTANFWLSDLIPLSASLTKA